MSLQRGIDGAEPLRPEPVGRVSGMHEQRRVSGVWRMAVGTLACPECDAPVAPTGTVTPSAPLACPYCGHGAAVRDFLTLGEPNRPARVEVRVVLGRAAG